MDTSSPTTARTTPAGRSPAVRVARWSATHPRRAIAAWVLLVVLLTSLSSVVGTRAATSLDESTGQSGTAERLLTTSAMNDPATETVLITARHGALDVPAADDAAADAVRAMRSLPEVARVGAPQRSPDGAALLVPVVMAATPQDAEEHVAPLVAVTRRVGAAHPAVRVEQVGSASLSAEVDDQVSSDLGVAAAVSLPVTLVILLVVFGAIIAAGVPVLLALSAVGAATGLSALVSHVVPDTGTTSSMILMMGMAVGVDYSLFYVKRHREERARGRGAGAAVEIAAQTSGHAVLVSGIAVIVAMVGMFGAHDATFSSLATGSVLVVAVAVVGSLTVLPALLGLLGSTLDRPRVPVLWRFATATREPRLWPALLRPALRRPAATLVVSVVAMLAVAAPALGMRLAPAGDDTLPQALPAVVALHRLQAHVPTDQSTIDVVAQVPAGGSARTSAGLEALATRLTADPAFVGASTTLRVSADGRVHDLQVSVPHPDDSAPVGRSVAALRTHLVGPALRGTGAVWAVGGQTASDIDYDRNLTGHMPWVVAFVVLATMVMILVIFRSLALALVTGFANLLSAAAAFGVMTLVFQHTWAQGLLGFRSTGAIVDWVPLFAFAVLSGLSMDYHVFVLSRIHELVPFMGVRAAVREGITTSAGTVTSAALVMVSVFSIFALGHLVELKELGVGLAVAVLVDALVIRGVVLPALLTVLGARCWPGAGRSAVGVRPAAELALQR